MKIAYIAHPVSGDVPGNISKILAIVRDINLTDEETVPFVPYMADLMALNDDNPKERLRGINNDIAVLKSGMVNEVWLFGDRISAGMRAEVMLARRYGIPVIAKTQQTANEL